MRALLTACALLLVAAPFANAAPDVHVAMDQQINVGVPGTDQSPTGDAIYAAFNSGSVSFHADEPQGYTRMHIQPGGGWWYTYVDLNLAGIGGQDLTGGKIEFDTRFYHEADSNTSPYADAPVFLRAYTYGADGLTYLGHRDYGIVYGTQAPWSNPHHPDWTRVMVDVEGAAFTDGGTFDKTNVSRFRFYGTNWTGKGGDFVDFKNLDLYTNSADAIPEPGTIALLGSGLIGMVPFLRRRK